MESMSLDELIKKKIVGAASKTFAQKNQKQMQRKFENPKKLSRPIFKETHRTTDARFTIIQKKRAKIVDARDKIVQMNREKGDVRQRLIEKRRQRGGLNEINEKYHNGQQRKAVQPQRKYLYNERANGTTFRRAIQRQHQQQQSEYVYDLVDVPRGYIDYDNMEQMEQEEFASAKRLTRTVTNDTQRKPDLSFSPTRQPYITMQGLNEPRFVSWGNSKARFDISKVPDVMDIADSRPDSISRRHSPELFQRRYVPEPKSQLSYEMRSRLERAPDPHASMGIFSNPHKMLPPQAPVLGRIVVSNLSLSVLQDDIVELFEDVGDLYTARIVRPGVAEVIYKSLEDAKKAVDTYHNRQLDGQPMKCLLVNPRATNKPTAPAMNSRLDPEEKDSLEIDIDALHKVLFRRK